MKDTIFIYTCLRWGQFRYWIFNRYDCIVSWMVTSVFAEPATYIATQNACTWKWSHEVLTANPVTTTKVLVLATRKTSG